MTVDWTLGQLDRTDRARAHLLFREFVSRPRDVEYDPDAEAFSLAYAAARAANACVASARRRRGCRRCGSAPLAGGPAERLHPLQLPVDDDQPDEPE